jgi:hypothetical protein
MHTIIHIRSFLESPRPFESVRFRIMFRSRYPANIMIRIKRQPFIPLRGWQQPQAIVIDENSGSTTLPGVRLHRLF